MSESLSAQFLQAKPLLDALPQTQIPKVPQVAQVVAPAPPFMGNSAQGAPQVYPQARGPPVQAQPQSSMVGMSGMGGLQPADFGGGGAMGGNIPVMSQPVQGSQDKLPFQPIETRKGSGGGSVNGGSASYNPNI